MHEAKNRQLLPNNYLQGLIYSNITVNLLLGSVKTLMHGSA